MVILEAAEFPPQFTNWIKECISTTSFSVCINGEPCGFFKGKRGLRQGDPLSPTLFLLAMEVFSELLKSNFEDGRIIYHDLCRNPLITHLSFADDVMIFFDGRSASLQGIKEVFYEFLSMSGLSLNMSKTTAYITGATDNDLQRAAAIGFKIGQLPVRYLGLPLLTRRMRKSDYSPLLDAITKRFLSWTVKPLSYSGRLQLISSVIYSITNFWMSAFLLPKGCLRELTKLCSNFLWSGARARVGNSKVSWKAICLPKKEGGLGLRNFSLWNVTLQLRLFWALLTKEESLWVAWVKEHWLKSHNIWSIQATSSASWVWRSLLHIRPLANRLVSCKLRNGNKASFWYDNWTGRGSLIGIIGQAGPQKLGLHKNATVAQACVGSTWIIPTARTRCPTLSAIRAQLLTLQPPNPLQGTDQFFWGDQTHTSTYFSTKKTWEILRQRNQFQEWSKTVWSKNSLPKHSFLFWVVNLNRLPVRTRLRRWGMNISDTCCICSSTPEDRDHLFLQCNFVLQIWLWLGDKLGESCSFQSWNQFTEWISSSTSTKQKILKIISSQSLIYIIWKERNSRLHNGLSNTEATVISEIDKTVRASLLALRSRRHHTTLLSSWFFFR